MNAENKPAGQEMVFDKYVAIALVVGIIAGFIIGNSVGASKSKVASNATTTSEAMLDDEKGTAPITEDEQGWISVKSDLKPGNTVTLSRIDLDQTFWVAIRDSREDDPTPYVLGAKKLMKGVHVNEDIYVSRAIEAGKSYDVVLYKDMGDFNYDASLLIESDGEPVGTTFKVQ